MARRFAIGPGSAQAMIWAGALAERLRRVGTSAYIRICAEVPGRNLRTTTVRLGRDGALYALGLSAEGGVFPMQASQRAWEDRAEPKVGRLR